MAYETILGLDDVYTQRQQYSSIALLILVQYCSHQPPIWNVLEHSNARSSSHRCTSCIHTWCIVYQPRSAAVRSLLCFLESRYLPHTWGDTQRFLYPCHRSAIFRGIDSWHLSGRRERLELCHPGFNNMTMGIRDLCTPPAYWYALSTLLCRLPSDW